MPTPAVAAMSRSPRADVRRHPFFLSPGATFSGVAMCAGGGGTPSLLVRRLFGPEDDVGARERRATGRETPLGGAPTYMIVLEAS